MINNATNDTLANWIVLWTHIQPCWSKHWGYSFSCEMVVERQIYVQSRQHFLSLRWVLESQESTFWTIEPLSKFEFGGGETVIKTAEAKNKIMISFYWSSRDRTFVIVKPSTTQVFWKCTQQTQKWFWYSVDVGKKLEKQNPENSCTVACEQLCCLVDEILVKRKWFMEMTYLLEKYTDSRTPLNLTQATCLRN